MVSRQLAMPFVANTQPTYRHICESPTSPKHIQSFQEYRPTSQNGKSSKSLSQKRGVTVATPTTTVLQNKFGGQVDNKTM